MVSAGAIQTVRNVCHTFPKLSANMSLHCHDIILKSNRLSYHKTRPSSTVTFSLRNSLKDSRGCWSYIGIVHEWCEHRKTESETTTTTRSHFELIRPWLHHRSPRGTTDNYKRQHRHASIDAGRFTPTVCIDSVQRRLLSTTPGQFVRCSFVASRVLLSPLCFQFSSSP